MRTRDRLRTVCMLYLEDRRCWASAQFEHLGSKSVHFTRSTLVLRAEPTNLFSIAARREFRRAHSIQLQRARAAIVSVCLVLCLFGAPVSATPRGQQVQSPSLESARQAYEASDYPQAVQILTRAAAGNPRNAEIHLLLAKTYFEMQSNDSAIDNAARAVQIDPNNSVYHEWLGKAYGQKAEQAMWFSALSLAKKARKEFGVAVNLDERNFSAQQALIEFDCAAPGIAGGGEDKALPKIEQLAAMDEAEGHYAAGNCRRQKKDYPRAEVEFDKALVNAKSPDLIFDIGDYALKRNQPQRLLAVVDAGQKASPSDARTKFYRAAALILQKQRPDEAESLLREYLSTAPR